MTFFFYHLSASYIEGCDEIIHNDFAKIIEALRVMRRRQNYNFIDWGFVTTDFLFFQPFAVNVAIGPKFCGLFLVGERKGPLLPITLIIIFNKKQIFIKKWWKFKMSHSNKKYDVLVVIFCSSTSEWVNARNLRLCFYFFCFLHNKCLTIYLKLKLLLCFFSFIHSCSSASLDITI